MELVSSALLQHLHMTAAIRIQFPRIIKHTQLLYRSILVLIPSLPSPLLLYEIVSAFSQ